MSVGVLLVAGERFNQSAAEREYARAAMVREQSQARSDLLAGALPYVGIIAVVAMGGAVFMGIIIFGLKFAAGGASQGEPGQLRIIERHTIVLLPEGAGRREMWRRIETGLIESEVTK
jgi:hypothetical protein